MSKTFSFAETIIDFVDTSVNRQIMGFSDNNRLVLGGDSGAGGGSGLPWGGIAGQLIQRKVAYDTTESGNMCLLPSASILDNLNHIRWHLKPARMFEVVPTDPPTFELTVGSGIWYFGENEYIDYSGGISPTLTAPTSDPRIDLIYLTSGGVISVKQGLEANPPTIPELTISGVLPLWAVYLTPDCSGVGWPCTVSGYNYNGYLYRDMRPFISYPGGGGIGGGAPIDAQYITLALNGTLTNERILTAGSHISITDGGAGGNITIAVVASGIDHGGLSGLGDDDHPQYLLVDGSRAMDSAANLLPTDVTGQELGAAGARWDLFADHIDMSDNGWIGNAIDDMRIIFVEGDHIEVRTNGVNLYTIDEDPSAATPMTATAANITIIGGDNATGDDAGICLRNEKTNIDWSIFNDESDYDHLKIARDGVEVAEFTTTGNFAMFSGNDIDPEDATGQNLGNSNHRWDLYTNEINIDNGGVIHCTTLGGPVITFDSIHDYLEITECRISIGHDTPVVALDINTPDLDYNGILLGSGTPPGQLGMIKFTGVDFFGYTPSGWVNLTAAGGGGTSVHNDLTGLQGGQAGEYYHLTNAQHTAVGLMVTAGLDALTSAEVDQLENIGATTISAAQWGYVGAMNQGVATGDSVTFADVFVPDGGTFGIAGNELLTVNAAGTFAFSGITGITVQDNDWIGLGAAAGRIEFDNQTPDEINFLDCRVGIGTSTPEAPLDVKATATDGIQISGLSGSISPRLRFELTDTDDCWTLRQVRTTNNFEFRSDTAGGDGTVRMLLTAAGNVGIGTTPQHRLHLHETTSGACYMQFTNSTTGSAAGDGALIGLALNEALLVWQQENNEISFGTNNIERMVIESSGEVVKPTNPAFSATLDADQTNLTAGSIITVHFNTEVFDVGGHFNTGTYTFTAPVTGKYLLSAYVKLKQVDADATYAYMNIKTTARSYFTWFDPTHQLSADSDYVTLHLSVIADMNSGDTALVKVRCQGGASQTDIDHNYSRFMGYLLG